LPSRVMCAFVVTYIRLTYPPTADMHSCWCCAAARPRPPSAGHEAKAAWIGPGGGVCDTSRCLQRACAAHRKSQPQLRDHKPSCGSRISGATHVALADRNVVITVDSV
jgi:hypothetical protein